jgi:hypothetical protein
MRTDRLAVAAIVASLVMCCDRVESQPAQNRLDRWAEFGVSVTAARDVIFVAASPKQGGRRGPGMVHVFERRDSAWVAAAPLSVPHVTMEDVFGVSMATHEKALVSEKAPSRSFGSKSR